MGAMKHLQGNFNPNEIPLCSIDKMTREKGNILYVLGDFGSKKLTFSSRQKRDECMAAIQRYARMSSRQLEMED